MFSNFQCSLFCKAFFQRLDLCDCRTEMNADSYTPPPDSDQSEESIKQSNDPRPLSKWWKVLVAFVMIYGFTMLIIITCKAYDDKPPIPAQVVDENGNTLFTKEDVQKGQELFLRNGLMDNGTVWGHGAYLGPDFPALTLNRMGKTAQNMLAEKAYDKPFATLNESEQALITSQVPSILKTNRYDAQSDTLTFTPYEVVAFQQEPAHWKEYFRTPVNNGGLKANLIETDKDLHLLSSYFTWAAWASVATRPGENYSYTNNFPYDNLVGNIPHAGAYVWSVASVLFLLGGIGLILFILGKNPDWEWHSNALARPQTITPSQISPSQGSLIKFVVVVGILFLAQTLVGGGIAHYQADPGNFYGFDLTLIFPSSLLRTWHLQLAIFWIATGFAAGGLFMARMLGGIEFKGQRLLTNILFTAFAIVIFGSLLSEWAGLSGWWQDASFWLGSQGWEYLELGRIWQYLLIVGLLAWFVVVARASKPALQNKETRPLTRMFLIAAFAIPFFYLPAIFYTGQTHYTVVDTWRFWIIHLWVEGFFELFATTMVALIFVELGLISRKIGLRIIYLDAILIFMGGIIGTGHHWYFSGQSQFNMALSGCFSALEVVPLVILCMQGYSFIKTADNSQEESSVVKFKWTLRYLMAVGFWNFLGAGVFGFLINMPIVSYFEIGTYLTPNHGHAAMFGVFGFLALGLCTFVLREACDDAFWHKVEKYIATAFWGLNIGLIMMLVCSLLPGGFAQIWDAINNGYWHARSAEFTRSEMMSLIGWLRMPGDLVFIIFGAIPFLYASVRVFFHYMKKR